MRMSDLAKAWSRDRVDTREEIVRRETKAALASFPNANGDETTALALCASSLQRNLADRTDERDAASAAFEYAVALLAADRNGAPVNRWVFMDRLRRGLCPVRGK